MQGQYSVPLVNQLDFLCCVRWVHFRRVYIQPSLSLLTDACRLRGFFACARG